MPCFRVLKHPRCYIPAGLLPPRRAHPHGSCSSPPGSRSRRLRCSPGSRSRWRASSPPGKTRRRRCSPPVSFLLDELVPAGRAPPRRSLRLRRQKLLPAGLLPRSVCPPPLLLCFLPLLCLFANIYSRSPLFPFLVVVPFPCSPLLCF